MLYFTRWKALAIILTALIVCLFAVPNFFNQERVKAWPAWAQRHIVLGLDLQGGSYLLLEVDSNYVKKERLDQVRDEDAAAFIVNPLTALAMFDLVREEGAKSFVLSAAASQLCKLIMGVARDEGFRPIAIVRRDDDGHLADAGAAHVLNATAPDFKARLAEVLKEEPPRIFLDAVTGTLGGTVFNAMGRGARWVVYGRMDAGTTVIPEPGQLIFMHKRIEGFWLTEWMRVTPFERKAAVVMEAQKRFADGRWKTDVTAVVPMAEAIARVPQELAKPDGKVFIAP
jgi:NADPH:quinone reductase-like Zn-dependent oxidoreductase